jgi:hypothetical protein
MSSAKRSALCLCLSSPDEITLMLGKVSGWPKNKPSKEQFNECAKQQGLGVSLKRGDPTSPQAPTAPSADGDTLSGVCEIANVILTNFLTDVGKQIPITLEELFLTNSLEDMKKLAHDICDGAVTYGTGFVTSDLGAIPSLFTLQGGRKKGLTIAHNNRQVQLVATVANIAGIAAKSTLVDLCVQAITYQAETCTTELKYGAFEAKVAHVQKASTSTWRDASGAVQAIFDFGFAMPEALTIN